MDKYTFAAIVPMYNRAKVVLETLDSIADQTVPPTVLVVVDDGSDDGSAESVERWIERRSPNFPVNILRRERGGAPAAINAGIEAAGDCQLVGILDSDDLWPTDYIDQMTAAFYGDNDKLVAATCDKNIVDYPSKKVTRATFKSIPTNATKWLFQNGSAGPSNTIYRMSAFRETGGFNPDIRTGYDLNFMLRLSLRGQWTHVPGPLATYRHNYAQMLGDVPPLSHSYNDRRFRRAQNMERFIFQEGGKESLDIAVWKPKLASLWFKAGKQLIQLGRNTDARDCFIKAIILKPWNIRARWGAMWAKMLMLRYNQPAQ